MPSHSLRRTVWEPSFATGAQDIIEPGTGLKMKRTNRRTRVPISLYPCHIEEKMTIKEVKGESVMEWKTKENDRLKEVWEKMEYVISDSDSDLDSTTMTANVNDANGENGNGGNDGCSYKTFTACNPKEFDGKGGVVALTRWIEKMESVWWNTQVQARGHEAAIGMSWNNFKALLMEELCPSNEMERLENRFWNILW
ncbi:hypothetical protein Tco_0453574 [Tanacetum coccineum]